MSQQIHPSAVVHAGAELGDDCQIGPFCIVGEHVRLGAGSRLLSHVVLEGHTRLGAGCEVHPFAVLGGKTQDLKFKGEVTYLEIGARTVVREYVTINTATGGGLSTRVGEQCLIQAYCHVAHDCQLGNRVIMSSGAMLAGHVEVDDGAVIGGMSGIVQFCKIGTLAMVGGYAKVTQDVLPYCIADGMPAEVRTINKIGMERNGKTPEQVTLVRQAFKIIFHSNLTLDNAMAELDRQFPGAAEIQTIRAFLTRSQKGLSRPSTTV
jgi:UDP-N-acetylglucosamine acyltransferase